MRSPATSTTWPSALTAPAGHGGSAGSPARSMRPFRPALYPLTSGSWLPATNASGVAEAGHEGGEVLEREVAARHHEIDGTGTARVLGERFVDLVGDGQDPHAEPSGRLDVEAALP